MDSSSWSTILVINPNSSKSVTEGLRAALKPLEEPFGQQLKINYLYCTGHPDAPPSIDDAVTSTLSAAACFPYIPYDQHEGFLVCCFSDHPLTHMLRQVTDKPVVGIFEAAISHALLVGKRFGIITTGVAWKVPLSDGVRSFMGGVSDRFVGVECTGLGVVELKTGSARKIEDAVKAASVRIAERGADVILLGCAGMAGMEATVMSGVAEAGLPPVKVVDGAKAGLILVSGLVKAAEL
ncbi:hypothetical protein JAAARDRAFT_126183 [Jaapia argillacea MUCL 33604]|uniref:Asp/Glu/hydantoin racemase n=1 Tax=Jaapia argillacea MUCL 33604 TaxID=933084 RepID=A0A067Q056_9AGAM|nr:hypothetical protein JAAARDRAFT_126183 [Jaapia argillacea MUCL 33604]